MTDSVITLVVLGVMALLNLALVLILTKELQVATFDPAFATAVGHLLAARRAGVWIPRADATNGRKAEPACERRCRVREACIRDDTDQRRRLQEWLENLVAGEAAGSSGLAGIVAELWRLGAAP